MARKWEACTTPKDFPEPPRYLVWRSHVRASIFASLSLVKTLVSNEIVANSDRVRYDYLVYEWDGAGWQQIYEIPKGSLRSDHPLWKDGVAPTHKQVISDDDVAAAIASIIGKS